MTPRTSELLRRPQPGPLGYWLCRSAMRRCLQACAALQCHFLLTERAC
jgi:hypothetical protein